MQTIHDESATIAAAKQASLKQQRILGNEEAQLERALQASLIEEEERNQRALEEQRRLREEEEEEARLLEQALRQSVEEAERKAREAERLEQDARYQESLRADRQKAERLLLAARLEEERLQALQFEQERKELEEAMKLSEALTAEQTREEVLKAKLAALPSEPASSEFGVVALQIRLNTGVKIERRFIASRDTMGTVRDFIDTRLLVDAAKFAPLLLEEYKLVADFPRREFLSDKNDKTLQELRLTVRTSLAVEPLN